MTVINALPTGETAFILRRALGNVRANWNDFLADCIRERTSFHGLTLTPVATLKAPGDRCKRPWYAASDVRTFIERALEVIGRATDREKLNIAAIEIDPAALALPWRARRATSIPTTPKEPTTE